MQLVGKLQEVKKKENSDHQLNTMKKFLFERWRGLVHIKHFLDEMEHYLHLGLP